MKHIVIVKVIIIIILLPGKIFEKNLQKIHEWSLWWPHDHDWLWVTLTFFSRVYSHLNFKFQKLEIGISQQPMKLQPYALGSHVIYNFWSQMTYIFKSRSRSRSTDSVLWWYYVCARFQNIQKPPNNSDGTKSCLIDISSAERSMVQIFLPVFEILIF